jgi:catechol 2,3-dioxygenase-like lactoylglutathione lyase family enzyme
MFQDVHHVSMYVTDLPGVERFLDKFFAIKPYKQEIPAPESVLPLASFYAIGPTLLEFMQPRTRFSMQYDYLRRAGGPVISHVAWTVKDLNKVLPGLEAKGVSLWEKGQSGGVSPHGGYLLQNVLAESINGIKFQFCQYLTAEEVKDPSGKYRQHYGPSTGGHDWVLQERKEGMLKHVHNATYHVWGVDYVVDYIGQSFGMKPFKTQELPDVGLRGASFKCGRTIAQFVEPTRFGSPGAEFILRFGPLSGYPGGGVSHVGWAVVDIDKRVRELRDAGVKFIQDKPVVSPHGGYRLIDVDPTTSSGLKLQLCEDVN